MKPLYLLIGISQCLITSCRASMRLQPIKAICLHALLLELILSALQFLWEWGVCACMYLVQAPGLTRIILEADMHLDLWGESILSRRGYTPSASDNAGC